MGDPVCEVQSDKVESYSGVKTERILYCVTVFLSQSAATIYIPYSGIIQELMYEVDDVATKGEPLLTIETDDEGGRGYFYGWPRS